jgi:hypothetical protein
MDRLISSIDAGAGSAETKQIAIMSHSVPNSAAKYFGGHAGAVGTIIRTVTTSGLRGDLLNICWNVELNICWNVERFTS